MATTHNCDEAIEQIYFFLDGEMTWYKRLRVRRHLRRCPPCHSKFEFEARFIDVVRRKGAEPAPPELIDRLRTFLNEHRDDAQA